MMGLYSNDIRTFIDHRIGWTKLQFAAAPEITLSRSMFGHDFYVTKSSQGNDSIVVPENAASTYQLIFSVKNMSEEDLYVKSVEVLNFEEIETLFERAISELDGHIPPEKMKLIKAESDYFSTMDSKTRESMLTNVRRGKFKVRLHTNFRVYTQVVQSVWFHNGLRYSILGVDSNITDFEYNHPEGVKNLGLLSQEPLQWPNF